MRCSPLALLLLWLLPGFGPGSCVPGLPPADPAPPARPGLRLPALHAEPDPVAGGRIVDAYGREVLLRGVNVNAFVEYWAYDPTRFTTYPFPPEDVEAIAGIGWNVVRLLLSWSRVEPEPGVYDEAYLDSIEATIRTLERRGVYTLIDLHQDAWSATLAARPGEACAGIGPEAFGWDGAPAWATLDGGAARCTPLGIRELSPAVITAFASFWQDAPGPGAVGVRTRYARMLAHLAARFSRLDAVAGYDLMNEPNMFSDFQRLSAFTADSIAAIRAAETAAGTRHRLVFFEPSITWSGGGGAPPPFAADDQIVYAPHLYQGGLDDQPLDAAVFARARGDAAGYGGAPVLSGEWGSDPARASDPADDYFERHQALQDEFRFGATLWTWREACGDPHKAADVRDGRVPRVWGLFEVDCTRDAVLGPRSDLVEALRRPLLRAAPGPIGTVAWDRATGRFAASGAGARAGQSFFVFWPARLGTTPGIESHGLYGIRRIAAPGGQRFVAGWARGGDWSLAITPADP